MRIYCKLAHTVQFSQKIATLLLVMVQSSCVIKKLILSYTPIHQLGVCLALYSTDVFQNILKVIFIKLKF